MDAESKRIEQLECELAATMAERDAAKAKIEELLARHARKENIYLNSLDAAVQEIERLKAGQPIETQVFEIALRAFVEQNTAKNKLIREFCEWLDEEFSLETWSSNSPGKKLWLRAQEAIQYE